MIPARWLRPSFRIFSVVMILAIALSTSAFSSIPSTQIPAGPVSYQPMRQGKVDGKLSSRLAMIAGTPALMAADQSSLLSLPKEGPGSLMRASDGKIMVYVYLSDMSEKHIQAIRDTGARVIHVSAEYRVVTAYVDSSALNLLATMDVVKRVREEYTPQTGGILPRAPVKASPSAPNACPWGAARSEGLDQLNIVAAWTAHSVDGTGVKVGVLSDSFNKTSGSIKEANDIVSGDLPGAANPCGYTTPVNVVNEYSQSVGSDEGRGMLQIVHDIAPSAQLSFASAFNGYYSFADNIKALRNTAGADVIVDDVYYFAEPFFQDGAITNAITTVVNSGAHYFTSAGNQNIIVGANNVGSYESPAFRSVSCAPFGSGNCHDFDPGAGTSSSAWFTLQSGGSMLITLQWAEPTFGVTTDLDFYIADGSTNTIVAGSEDNNLNAWPVEIVSIDNTTGGDKTYKLVIKKWSGAANPRLKFVFSSSWGVKNAQFQTSSGGDIIGPTLGGHSASTSAFSVAAAPYNDSTRPETFSSRGPAVHYFAPDTGLGTPSAALPSPETIVQPDFTATDGGCTTFFGGFSNGCNRFYGTSAAAPHAASIAALIVQKAKSRGQTLTRAQMKTILTSTSVTMSNGSANAVGSGLLNANAALGALPLPPPGAFNKTAPANGATGVPTTTTLSWSASSGATSYRYCYYTTQVSDCAGITWPTTTLTSVQVTGLSNSATYHWQVQAVNAGGSTPADGDNWFTFITTAPVPPPGAFTKTAPANNATNVPTPSINLIWGPSTGATSYEYCIYSTNVADCTGAWTSTVANFAVVNGLTPNTVYHWQVQARNAGGTTRADGDNWGQFTTATPDPKGKLLVTSAQGPTGGDVTVTVSAVMDNGYKLGGAAFNLNYNIALISALSCTPDPDNVLAVDACNIVSTPGVAAISGSTPAGVTGTFRLATITFHINGLTGASNLFFDPINITDQAGYPLVITSSGGRILINGTPQIFLPLLTK